MNNPVNEHDIVVNAIIAANKADYTALSNIEKEENYIAQLFPDIILLDKKTEKPVFKIEVKKNGNIAQCIQQWKSVPNIPATLYIIVPLTDLANAKSIAGVVGLNTRFGSYTVDDKQRVLVKYE